MVPLNKFIPKTSWKIALLAAIIPALLIVLIVGVSLNNFAEYGWGIFVISPFSIGLMSSLLNGIRTLPTKKGSFKVTALSLFFFSIFLISFGIEGLMCIIMAFPIGLLCAFIGSSLGYFLLNKFNKNNLIPIILLFNFFLLTSFITLESQVTKTKEIYPVSTSININASKQRVWNNLIAFKEIEAPLAFIFRYGISYPVDSEVKGKGVGAIRYCNFSTGSFVEPVDVWNEPHHLHFFVEKQPLPMKELSPYDIHPKHLHGYFVSTKGEFRLEESGTQQTKITGTTWYYNKLYPAFYWRLWTDYIIHSIHERVLSHIKQESEHN